MKTKIIAIPTENGIMSSQCGLFGQYTLFTVLQNEIRNSQRLSVPFVNQRESFEWLLGVGITDVIACQIDEEFLMQCVENKINVFVGVPISAPEELLHKYLLGKLVSDEKLCKNDYYYF